MSKIIKKTIKDDNLVEMFNSMLSADGDPEIVAEKDENVKNCIRCIIKTLVTFANGPFASNFNEYTEWCAEFKEFATDCNALLDLPYKDIKDHNKTRVMILACRELVIYSSSLDGANLNDRWVTTHPGLVFEPFTFTKLDIKHIWNNEKSTSAIKKYCLTTLAILYKKCREVYDIVTSPDIDVSRFSEVIVSSIEQIKNQPELNRCRDAFEQIKNSVKLLENNFQDYYKDMLQSKNPNTIIENFIIDVSKGQGQKVNMKVMSQFKTIIGFYRKQSQGKIKDPKIQQLFETLNSRMDILEKAARKQEPEEKK